ncbi:hypothetical protein HAX54_009470 [Datura stramonium]|uniref:Uncharacterized protein n=1 Tax=Datura stramonium TaxID=4076 RepID=A0ABS8TFN5_DATST|nr:hypothetical protein [Datura stramonium]
MRGPSIASCSKVLRGYTYIRPFNIVSGANLPFLSLTIMLYQQTGVPQKVSDCMLGFDAPFNTLRVKGASGKGRKERKTDSEDDSNGLDGDWASLVAIQELLGGLPRLPQGRASSNAAVVDPKAYREHLFH